VGGVLQGGQLSELIMRLGGKDPFSKDAKKVFVNLVEVGGGPTALSEIFKS